MTPTVEIPWPLALIYWTIRGLVWLVIWTFALLAGILFACGLLGWRIGERIEDRRRDRRFSASRPT